MFLAMFFKTQNIVQTMHLAMLIAHPYWSAADPDMRDRARLKQKGEGKKEYRDRGIKTFAKRMLHERESFETTFYSHVLGKLFLSHIFCPSVTP